MAWVKQRFLGSGSYGNVHLAVQSENMEIAVKSAGAANTRCSDSLKREGQFLNSLRGCPFIVTCFGEDRSTESGEEVHNLLLEYAPGGSLRRLINSHVGGMPESDVAWYTYQILKGIHHVHSLGFIHCDLKPENILVFPRRHARNWVKLCDFGMAKRAGGFNIYGDSHRGTLPYAPPESVTWGEYSPPKDIWALGCIVVEMITGEPVWLLNYTNKYSLSTLSISQYAMDFMKSCFHPDPRQRWTAEMLLVHPFIIRNNHWFEMEEREEDEGFLNNPLGSTEWICSKGLFTPTTPPPPSPKFSAIVGDGLLQKDEDEVDDGTRIVLPEVSFCIL